MKTKNGTMYFFCGLGIGAAVATLFAERSGAETRARLQAAVDDGIDRAKSKAGALGKSIDDTVQMSRDTVQQSLRTVSAAVEAGREAYRAATETFAEKQ